MKHHRLIVSTDLDGTLLDHHNYSWDAALPSIGQLKEITVPIVINTSKTYSEVKQLQKDLNLDAPFIVENGSAIYYPKNRYQSGEIIPYSQDFDCQLIGETRSEVLKELRVLKEEFQYQFEGFDDWSVKQVVERTGLSESAAKLAQEREYSEPIVWMDSEARFQTFAAQLADKGLRTIRGGRFIHVLGQANKGSALKALAQTIFANQSCSFICLGDSYNDLDMLAIADYPVFVRSPAHDFPEHNFSNNNTIYTDGYGPVGWHEAIESILNKLKENFGEPNG